MVLNRSALKNFTSSSLQQCSILLVDDDADIRAELGEYLSSSGFLIHEAEDKQTAMQKIEDEDIDLIVLDLWIGKDNGFDVLRELRLAYSTPCIMVTAHGETTDRVVGLELGADDYIVKPVNMRELLARIRALFRRSASSVAPTINSDICDALQRPQATNGWQFDPVKRDLRAPNGEHIPLTTAECDLLIELVTHEGYPQTREELCQRVFNRSWQPYDRSLDSIVVKLRRKLERNPDQPMVIKTIRSKGYLFTGFPDLATS